MPYIVDINAKEIIDSNGSFTTEIEIELESGIISRSSVYSESKNKNNSILIVSDYIAPEIIGIDCRNQLLIDDILMNLKSEYNLDNSLIMSISLGIIKASSEYSGLPIYKYLGGFNYKNNITPVIKILENKSVFDDIYYIPNKSVPFKKAINIALDINSKLSNLEFNDEFELLNLIIDNFKMIKEKDFTLGIKLNKGVEISYYEELIKNYPISLINLYDEDLELSLNLNKKYKKNIKFIGKDELNTNMLYLNKYNTVSSIFKNAESIKNNNQELLVTNCFGQTEDTIISDISIALKADYVMFGKISGFNVTKYNQILRILDEINNQFEGLKK